MKSLRLATLSQVAAMAAGAFTNGIDCKPCADTQGTCAIEVKVNLFASETGYFEIDGCEGTNPTLHLQVNRAYKFRQEDITNWFHLIGFAYEADGAHVPVDELEPGITHASDTSCVDTLTCPAPMYFLNGVYQGNYSNIPELVPATGSDDFGLDAAEPLFFHPIGDWQGYGIFETYLNFSQTITDDIFYFCHVHSGMSARIKLLDADGNKLNENDSPELPYEYDQVLEYDAKCGTFNITDFQLPNDECIKKFVCLADGVDHSTFSNCVEAMDCHMIASMTTNFEGQAALFCHQMIPHHQNAINMAKSLLKNTELECVSVKAEEGDVVPPDCELLPLLYDIVNTQNSQIIDMRDALEQLKVEEFADCVVVAEKSKKERVLLEPSRDLQDDEGAFEHGVECTPCLGTDGLCIVKAKVNFFAGQYGYYTFDGCVGVNPTLLLAVGRTYVFDQEDVSNWYHLIGFAYEADGAHVPVDELEPGIVPPGSSSTCDENLSCPAPMYWMDGMYAGMYSNIPNLAPIPDPPSEDFGLDVVEPLFFHPLADWQEYGKFEAALNFNVQDFPSDFFYFCHIHAGMSGRIKLIDASGNKLNADDTPQLPYEYDVVTGHDEECGTFGLNEFQLPHNQCPQQFVCPSDQAPIQEESATTPVVDPTTFTKCIDSANCAMLNGMTTNYGDDTLVGGGTDDIVLFCRQMIPHHENAINMAKTLLKSESAQCSDSGTEEGDAVAVGCILEPIVRGIINTQNYQIQTMQGLLERFGAEETSNCDVQENGSEPISAAPCIPVSFLLSSLLVVAAAATAAAAVWN